MENRVEARKRTCGAGDGQLDSLRDPSNDPVAVYLLLCGSLSSDMEFYNFSDVKLDLNKAPT